MIVNTRDGACTSLAWVVLCVREAMLEGNNLQHKCKLSAMPVAQVVRAQTPAAAHASKSKGAGNMAVRPLARLGGRAISASPSRPRNVGPIPHLLTPGCDQLLRPTVDWAAQIRCAVGCMARHLPAHQLTQLRLHRFTSAQHLAPELKENGCWSSARGPAPPVL